MALLITVSFAAGFCTGAPGLHGDSVPVGMAITMIAQNAMEPVNDSLSGKLTCMLPSITARLMASIGDEIAANCAPALLKRREQRVPKDLLCLCLILTFCVVLTTLVSIFIVL